MSNLQQFVDPIPHKFHEIIDKAERLMDLRLWPQAWQVLQVASSDLGPGGATSAYFNWLAAVAADQSGLLPEAVLHIARARAADPLSSNAIKSENVILERLAGVIGAVGCDSGVCAAIAVLRRTYAPNYPGRRKVEEKLAEGWAGPSGAGALTEAGA